MTEHKINITQGEYATSDNENVVITTLLGSCVSCCLWDPVAGVGGMNHMLLARGESGDGMNNLAGVNAMEIVINEMIKLGAVRSRMQAKAFGGARMVSGLSDIGKSNSDFTLEFLAREGIECLGHSLGGTASRNVKFWPFSGRVLQRQSGTKVVEAVATPTPVESGNDMELF
ncbi:MAG: chemotaxis protein CheD [Paracoccaceae bacterium]|uniref:chemotaxis protein CheD n=1 Tax=Nonlabens ulvanivorans TaxID=906888 RepID=UPI00328E0CB5